MERDWSEYPFSDYKLKVKNKKSYKFVRVHVECECGRKANVKCVYNNCSRCCRLGTGECRVHAAK